MYRCIHSRPRLYRNHCDDTILEGHRQPDTGLWMVPVEIDPKPKYYLNLVKQPNKTADLVAFAHASLFSPALTTLMKAVKLFSRPH